MVNSAAKLPEKEEEITGIRSGTETAGNGGEESTGKGFASSHVPSISTSRNPETQGGNGSTDFSKIVNKEQEGVREGEGEGRRGKSKWAEEKFRESISRCFWLYRVCMGSGDCVLLRFAFCESASPPGG
ncbi:hypothetical protein L6452_30899 [Arctium lappa]|uniref:Uncharacterized protein n=1 Tax=Arctium lappa TaxID=4217 RepID=A0ACB8ZJ12_ARCLA|nr:hypothetical protein L6452_30899 [Arctium lappa]